LYSGRRLGNHFLEVQYDENDQVYIMVHSGSRGIGKKLGDYFNEVATKLNEKWYSSSTVPFLPVDTEEGQAYVAWTELACKFAYLSRRGMLNEVKTCLRHEFPNVEFITSEMTDDVIDETFSVHHNYARLEDVFGKPLYCHRKGACSARDGELGIIPGNMASNSYIVKGKGNKLSMNSSSHGAGRNESRMAFSRKMKDSYDEIEKSLEGVIHSDFSEFDRGKMKGVKDVSEAPQAYKNIENVMSQQADLVEPIVKLSPLISLKG